MEIYKILSDIMKERNMSIAEVARVCNLADSTVRGIISRKQKSVALDVAFKLSDGLNVPLEKLNGMTEKEKPTTVNSDELDKHLQDPFIRETLKKLDQLTPELRAAALAQLDILINVQESQNK